MNRDGVSGEFEATMPSGLGEVEMPVIPAVTRGGCSLLDAIWLPVHTFINFQVDRGTEVATLCLMPSALIVDIHEC